MKKAWKFLIVIVFVAIIAGVWFLTQLNKPPAPLTGEDGKELAGPGGETYQDYTGEPGKVTEKVEAGEKTYYISGNWIWNEELTEAPGFASAGAKNIAAITFTTAKQETLMVSYSSEKNGIYYADGEYITLYYSDDSVSVDNVYDAQYGWFDGTMRFMDCGAEPQQVSKEFYEWFTANAQPADKALYTQLIASYIEEHKSYQVSGYWVWDYYIDYYPYSLETQEWSDRACIPISGTIATGDSFDSYYVLMAQTGMRRLVPYGGSFEGKWFTTFHWDQSNHGWFNYSYRYIYLGEDPQTLGSDEYAYFVANARPCTKEEYDEAAHTAETNHAFVGLNYEYLFTETIQWTEEVGGSGNYYRLDEHNPVDFFSNGEYFIGWTIIYDETQIDRYTGGYTIQYVTPYKQFTVYTSKDGWVDDAYRTMTLCKNGLLLKTILGCLAEDGHLGKK